MNYSRPDQEEVIVVFHALDRMEPAKQPRVFYISLVSAVEVVSLLIQSELSSSLRTATSEGTNLGKKSMQRAGLELWKDDEGGATKIAAPRL